MTRCQWGYQEFTHVSGTLGGGVGYMCAIGYNGDCNQQVRVDGTTAAGQGPTGAGTTASDNCQSDPSCDDETGQVTLNSGDAVFCSP